MLLGLQCRHFLRLARRQRGGFLLAGLLHTIPFIATPQSRRLQPLSNTPCKQQEPRQPLVPGAPSTVPSEPVGPIPTETPPERSPAPTEHDNPKKKNRLAPRLILAVTCTVLGLSAGSSLRLLFSPPPPPEPGSEVDAYMMRVLHEQAAKLPVVQRLSSEPATWESWDAYETLSPQHRARHISAGALTGVRGVGGYQRVFWNKGTGEMVSVIYFGNGTTGWPGVVHGGCLATILDESCGRAAFKEWGGRPGVTANLGLEYKKMTMANGFYVVRCKVRSEEELPLEERGKRHYKCWVDATVEDAVTGSVTVVAEALFVGGKGKKGGGFVLGDGGPLGGNQEEAHTKF
ncbi:hypothetical protein N657DRAFT_359764 [Parathielavia appendiculata]|uniref:Thioesterase domain-containing protein n=1 Tax=Parathielavia appendiculata TaxID=2587402 RepID=A0AAN6U3C4_9PEZI|nr:hypothetical protein N657DRAFT_359764 [Parathielavia appendiculata]